MKENWWLSKTFIVFCLFAILIMVSATVPYVTDEHVTITVKDKERVRDGESSRYLIFTEGETFKNSDCLFRLKFRSSDIYGNIEPGQTYKAHVYGFRVPFLSMYRNIISVSEVEK